MKYPNPPKHGALVRGGEFTDSLAAQLQQIQRLTADLPIEVLKNGDAWHLHWALPPCRIVRITGHAEGNFGSSGQTLPDNHYTGIEQITHLGDELSQDLPAGVEFTAAFPLIEVNGVTNVPTNAVVYAVPSIIGDHYCFIYASGTGVRPCSEQSGGSGSGSAACCHLQISDIIRSDNDVCSLRQGCLRIVDSNGDPVDLFLEVVDQ